MKVGSTIWKYTKPTETMCIMFGFFLVLAAVTGVQMYRNSESEKYQATVKYENLAPEIRRQVESIADDDKLGENDSNARYAERVREGSSIGLGLSLFLVRERVSNDRVLTLTQTMDEFAQSPLLPPGCRVLKPDAPSDYGLLQTERGIYYIRYSPSPLKIEILSAGFNGLADGSTYIMRVPDTSAANLPVAANSHKITSAGAWATLFEAPSDTNHYIPPAFAPIQTYTAMNWQIRPLQQTEFTDQRMQELNSYLQRQQ